MMKYIRLGNDIYQIIKEKEGYFELRDALDVKMKCYTFMSKREQDYKIADTIEELCDAYVIIYKDTKGILFMPTEINTELAKTETIFGAIWTDKGLIYVAKMNDKGELELL